MLDLDEIYLKILIFFIMQFHTLIININRITIILELFVVNLNS